MKFNQLGDITKAIFILRKEKTGKNIHYPIAFKLAVCEYMKKHKVSTVKLAEQTEVGKSTLWNWQKQFEEGLFTMEGAYNVSNKSKELNAAILADLNQELEDLTEKIRIVEAAERIGLKVVA